MSAETHYRNILEHAKTQAFQLSDSTEVLVEEAIKELDESIDLLETSGGTAEYGLDVNADGGFYDPMRPDAIPGGLSISGGNYGWQGMSALIKLNAPSSWLSGDTAKWKKDQEGKNPSLEIPSEFPEWETVSPPKLPVSPDLNKVQAVFSAQRPVIRYGRIPNYPKISIGKLADMTRLDELELPQTDALPRFPVTDLPDLPEFLKLRALEILELEPITAPTLTPPPTLTDLPDDSVSLDTVVKHYMDLVPLPDSSEESLRFGNASERALKLALGRIQQVFEQRYEDPLPPAIRGALVDRTTRRLELIEDKFDETLHRMSTLGGWSMPRIAFEALENDAHVQRQAWTAHARSKLSVLIEDYTRDFFEHCGDLYALLRDMLVKLKTQETDLSFEAFEASTLYAKTLCQLLLRRSERELERIEFEIMSAQADVDIAETELKIALANREMTAAFIEIEQIQQDQDKALLDTLVSQHRAQKAEVDVWTRRVKAARATLLVAKNVQATYKTKLSLFDSQLSAADAMVDARIAEINGDKAEYELREQQVGLYTKQVAAFSDEIAAKNDRTQAQLSRNEFEVERFVEETKYYLDSLRTNVGENDYNLLAFRTSVADYLATIRPDLKKKEVSLKYDEAEARGQEQAEDLTREMLSLAEKTELARMEGIAEAYIAGANTYAGMALKAMSAANNIAGLYVQEF